MSVRCKLDCMTLRLLSSEAASRSVGRMFLLWKISTVCLCRCYDTDCGKRILPLTKLMTSPRIPHPARKHRRKKLFENFLKILEMAMAQTKWHEIFLETYEGLGYKVIPGSSLLDDSIPMSFVMSAGLVQVERAVTPLFRQGNNRFALLQNCFRHFDLDRIGQSDTHLSFFRMLGAFTFGQSTDWNKSTPPGIWQHTFTIFHLKNCGLLYFGGDTIAGNKFEPDLETYHAWREVGVRENQLLGLDGENNFWKQSAIVMGSEHASKCGPNSEIFFDRGEICVAAQAVFRAVAVGVLSSS